MTWREAQLTLRLEAEERVGASMRENARMAKAREDAAVAAVVEALA